MGMKKLGKKGGFNKGTLVAFACACNCNMCLCSACNNCQTVLNSTGMQMNTEVTGMKMHRQSFGPMTLLS